MKYTATIRTKQKIRNWEDFVEKYRFTTTLVGTFLTTHIITWFVILCINIVFWKTWQMATYLLIERILIVIVLIVSCIIWWGFLRDESESYG